MLLRVKERLRDLWSGVVAVSRGWSSSRNQVSSFSYFSVHQSHVSRYSEKSRTKCIGITIETRPDYCLKRHLGQMLSYGCTRLEIGVQVSFQFQPTELANMDLVECGGVTEAPSLLLSFVAFFVVISYFMMLRRCPGHFANIGPPVSFSVAEIQSAHFRTAKNGWVASRKKWILDVTSATISGRLFK